jgi:serine/threonine protein phosphatase PrpC
MFTWCRMQLGNLNFVFVTFIYLSAYRYDGHASSRASEYASRRLHEVLAAQPAVIQCRGSDDPNEDAVMEKALKEAFGVLDEEIIDDANHKGKQYGTTAVCALIVNKVMYVAHCGDSRAILFRDGAAVQLTQDHKPASNPTERARIEAQGGEVNVQTDYVISSDHKSALNMSRLVHICTLSIKVCSLKCIKKHQFRWAGDAGLSATRYTSSLTV